MSGEMIIYVVWAVFAVLGASGLLVHILNGIRDSKRWAVQQKQWEIAHQDFRFFANRILEGQKNTDFKQFDWFKDMFRELSAIKMASFSPHAAANILREKRLLEGETFKREEASREHPIAGTPWQPAGTEGVMTMEG